MGSPEWMSRQFNRFLVLTAAAALIFASVGNAAMQEFKNLSTGVGIDTRIAHPDYSLLLKFAEKPHGMLLGDITVAIYRDNEKIFESLSPEPWFFVDLPVGKYTIRATNTKGIEQKAGVSISGKGQKVVTLLWKTEDVDLGVE